MYKEQIKLQLNKDKGPKTVIKDQDYKRIYVEDRPSSEDEEEAKEGKEGNEGKEGEAEEIKKFQEEQALKRAT